jgi:hypothetical protein
MCEMTNVFKRILVFVKRVDNITFIQTMDNQDFYMKIFDCATITDDTSFIVVKMDYLNLMNQAIEFIERKIKRATKSIEILRDLQGRIARLNLNDTFSTIQEFKKFCSNNLDAIELLEENNAGELDVPEVDKEELNKLTDDIKNSSIDKYFMTVIIKNLNDLKSSIDKYSILGVEGIKDDINKLTGAVFTGIRNSEGVQEEEKGILKKIIGVIESANSVFDFRKNTIEIGAAVTPLIAIVEKIIG